MLVKVCEFKLHSWFCILCLHDDCLNCQCSTKWMWLWSGMSYLPLYYTPALNICIVFVFVHLFALYLGKEPWKGLEFVEDKSVLSLVSFCLHMQKRQHRRFLRYVYSPHIWCPSDFTLSGYLEKGFGLSVCCVNYVVCNVPSISWQLVNRFWAGQTTGWYNEQHPIAIWHSNQRSALMTSNRLLWTCLNLGAPCSWLIIIYHWYRNRVILDLHCVLMLL